MNIIDGMMIPETNCAAKLASKSSSFLARKASSTSRRRPKTRTSSWPVNDSSIWPLSAPVCRHCATKCFWLRLPMARVSHSDTGIVTSAIKESSGETTNIISSTPNTVRMDVMSWLIVCCRLVETLSMSFVTRESTSPRCLPSK